MAYIATFYLLGLYALMTMFVVIMASNATHYHKVKLILMDRINETTGNTRSSSEVP